MIFSVLQFFIGASVGWASGVVSGGLAPAVVYSGAIDTPKLATDAVTTAKILNGAVDTAKLASDAVTTAKIINAAVDTAKIATDAVTAAKILSATASLSKVSGGSLVADSATSDTFLGTATVNGNAFSVGGSTLVVTGGNVGIGTTSPSAKLHMSTGTFLLDGTGSEANIGASSNVNLFSSPSASPGPYPTIAFNSYATTANKLTNTGYMGIFQFQVGDGSLHYYTSASGAAGVTPALTDRWSINNTGKVGIGTTSPGTKLHISSGNLTMDGTGAPATGYAICFDSNHVMGHCTGIVGADGTCSCSAP